MTSIEELPFIGISDDRLAHMRQVATRAREISIELFGWTESKARSMYILGFLHDVGYAFSSDQSQHEELGGELLRNNGYEHWREIFYHGNPDSLYESDELFVLNLADMQTSSDGRHITIEERLDGIADTYGTDSSQFKQAQRLAYSLEQKLKHIKQSNN